MKFKRTYRLNIQSSGANQSFAVVGGSLVPIRTTGVASTAPEAINVVYPMTLYFNIKRSTLSEANRASFKIMNLGEASRRKIFHDWYDTANYRQITLTAGYEEDPKLPTIFQGNIQFAQSFRQKQDWVTEIEAFDGVYGMVNGQISTTLPTGYRIPGAIEQAVQKMPRVKIGAIGDISIESDRNTRGLTLMGNSWDLIVNGLAPDSNAFIDNESVYVLGKNEYILTDTDPFIISADTGLLETPRKGQNTLELKMLFEPRIFVGMQVQVLSEIPFYNGLYVVQGIEHSGVISGAVSGELSTKVTVYAGEEQFRGVERRTIFAGAA